MLQATPYVCGLQHMTDRLLNVDTEYLVSCAFVNHDNLFSAALSLHIAHVIACRHNCARVVLHDPARLVSSTALCR